MNKTAEWAWTIGVGVLSGALTLYGSVKAYAIDKLHKEGAFDQAAKEAQATYQKQVKEKPHGFLYSAGNDVDTINHVFKAKRDMIVQQKGVDSFSGAWKSLVQKDRTKAIVFASIASVAMGFITNYVARKGLGGGLGGDGEFDAGMDWGSSGHHHAWGHDFDGFDFGGFDI